MIAGLMSLGRILLALVQRPVSTTAPAEPTGASPLGTSAPEPPAIEEVAASRPTLQLSVADERAVVFGATCEACGYEWGVITGEYSTVFAIQCSSCRMPTGRISTTRAFHRDINAAIAAVRGEG